MSREHLYRAKRVDWKELPKEEWLVEGAVFQSDTETRIATSFLSSNESEEAIMVASYLVDPETVREYTGLADKNGGRFEGDVFQASDGDYIQRYIIAWNEDSLEWSAESVGDPEGTLPLSEFKVGEIDVIGNVFDNPELLKGDEVE